MSDAFLVKSMSRIPSLMAASIVASTLASISDAVTKSVSSRFWRTSKVTVPVTPSSVATMLLASKWCMSDAE